LRRGALHGGDGSAPQADKDGKVVQDDSQKAEDETNPARASRLNGVAALSTACGRGDQIYNLEILQALY